MFFNDAWAKDIAHGNVLGVPAPRPRHLWHSEVAAEAHRLRGAREPFDERWIERAWAGWLGDRSFYQDPLYAYSLAAVYAAGGTPQAMWIVQSVLGMVIAVLVAVIGGEVWDARVGLAAGLMAALYAPLLFYEATLVRSILQALFLTASMALAVHAARAEPRRGGWWAACGACAGLGILAHATSMVFAGALGLWIAFFAARRQSRETLAYAGGIVLALLPLVSRNAAVGLPLLETSSARAVNVITALAVDAQPRTGFHISAHTARILEETGGAFLPTLRATLATHPGVSTVARQAGEKILALLEGREATDNVSFDYFLLQAPIVSATGLRFAVVSPLAIAGLVLAARNPRAGPMVIGAATVLAVAVLFFPSSRVRFPGVFALIPFAGCAFVTAIDAVRARRARTLAVPGACALVAALVAWAPWLVSASDLRHVDFAVGNEIAMHRVRLAEGDPDLQARLLSAQLDTEPRDLATIDPARPDATLSVRSARLAASFSTLHAAAARVDAIRGDDERASHHLRRAEILAVVAAQDAARPPK